MTFMGEQQRVELTANLFGAQLLEEAGEEVARVVDQNINSAKLRDSGIDRRLRILWTGDVEFDCQQAFVIAHCSRDLRSIAASRNNGVAGVKAALAMSTPKPRPAPVISQTFFSVMT